MVQLILAPKLPWLLRYCRLSMTPKFSKFSPRPDSCWRTYTVQFRLLEICVPLLSGNSLEIRHRFPSFFLRSITLLTALMLLQVGTPNSASILLIPIWLQHSVLAARVTLVGRYLHRPVCETMLWYGKGWHVCVIYGRSLFNDQTVRARWARTSLRGIETSKGQEWRRYGEREMRQ